MAALSPLLSFFQISFFHFSATKILHSQRKEVENPMCRKGYFFRQLVQEANPVLHLNEHSVLHLFRQFDVVKWNIQQRVWPLSCRVHLLHLDSFKDIHAKNLATVNVLWYLLGNKHKHLTSSASFALLLKVCSLLVFLLSSLKKYSKSFHTFFFFFEVQNTVWRGQQDNKFSKKYVFYLSICWM